MEHKCEGMPEGLLIYDSKDEGWWLRYKDGSYIEIKYCPFCGEELQEG